MSETIKPKLKKAKIRFTKKAQKTKAKKGGKLLASEALIKKGSRELTPNTHVCQGDNVVVISGDDKGKIGKVIQVFNKEGKVTVEGVNIIKRHRKSQGPGRPGEIIETEAKIPVSKVMQWDEKAKKASRVSKKTLDNGTKVRVYQASKEQID